PNSTASSSARSATTNRSAETTSTRPPATRNATRSSAPTAGSTRSRPTCGRPSAASAPHPRDPHDAAHDTVRRSGYPPRHPVIRFSDILGQTAALDVLTRAYAAGRLPHALIFAGPTGVGKGTTARALSAVLLCEHPTPAPEPCGRCASCRAFDAGAHPD